MRSWHDMMEIGKVTAVWRLASIAPAMKPEWYFQFSTAVERAPQSPTFHLDIVLFTFLYVSPKRCCILGVIGCQLVSSRRLIQLRKFTLKLLSQGREGLPPLQTYTDPSAQTRCLKMCIIQRETVQPVL